MEAVSTSFGASIRAAREQKGLSLRKLAQMLPFDPSSLSKVERGETQLPQPLVKKLADILELDYRELQVQYLSEKLLKELDSIDYAQEALAEVEAHLKLTQTQTPDKQEKQRLLRDLQAYFRQLPIEKAWIFGSFARNEENRDSDLDILVSFQQPNKLDLFDYVGIRQDLEELTGRKVDLVEEGYLIPDAEKAVEKEKILVYEHEA